MENILEITEFVTKDNLSSMGLSLMFGTALVLIIVQANKGLVDSMFKSLAKIPYVNMVIKKPLKTKTFTSICCYGYTAFVLSYFLKYPLDFNYLALLIINASILSVLCKGGFDYVFKGIKIVKDNPNKDLKS